MRVKSRQRASPRWKTWAWTCKRLCGSRNMGKTSLFSITTCRASLNCAWNTRTRFWSEMIVFGRWSWGHCSSWFKVRPCVKKGSAKLSSKKRWLSSVEYYSLMLSWISCWQRCCVPDLRRGLRLSKIWLGIFSFWIRMKHLFARKLMELSQRTYLRNVRRTCTVKSQVSRLST